MEKIGVNIYNEKVGKLFFIKEKNSFGFNYTYDTKPISLIMPYTEQSYI